MIDFEDIEKLVQGRNIAGVRLALPVYLRKNKGRDAALYQACDWYRRLGLYLEGFRLVRPDSMRQLGAQVQAQKGRRLLWAARFLNLLGSPELALPLLAHLELREEDDYWIAGNIYLVNFEPQRALFHFTRMLSLTADLTTYQSRVRRLGLADSLSSLSRFAEAEAMARQIIRDSKEPLLLGIAHQAAGEYCARAGAFSSAKILLERATGYFPRGDRSADRAFLTKWLGYVRAHTGEREEGIRELRQAKEMLRRLRLRPEAWLDAIRLLGELGALGEEEAARLSHYPGLCEGFRRSLSRGPEGFSFGEPGAHLEVDLAREEYLLGNVRYSGLPNEIRILAWAKIAGPWGLDLLKVKSLLWPGEAHAYFQLEGRLTQLVHRARHIHGVRLALAGGVLRLESRGGARVSARAGGDPWPTLLREHSEFAASTVSEHYCLSKTQRSERLRQWESRGWIRRQGAGPRTRYLRTKGF